MEFIRQRDLRPGLHSRGGSASSLFIRLRFESFKAETTLLQAGSSGIGKVAVFELFIRLMSSRQFLDRSGLV